MCYKKTEKIMNNLELECFHGLEGRGSCRSVSFESEPVVVFDGLTGLYNDAKIGFLIEGGVVGLFLAR